MIKAAAKLLIDKDSPLLRAHAVPVAIEEIGSKKIQNAIGKMKQALYAEDDGVAIAAPQIGVSLRIFVVKGGALGLSEHWPENAPLADLVFINPEIVKVSKKKRKMEEGCLSLRYLYGEVLRHEKVTIQAFNEKGEEFRAGAAGLLAQIFQHEIDHLDGVLFTDKAENVRNLPPEDSGSKQ